MATVTSTFVLDREELDRRCRPRDDHLVREVESGAAQGENSRRFDVDEGPFSRYSREISWQERPDGGLEAVQRIDFTPALPFFAPLYVMPLRRALPDGVPLGRQRVWTLPNRLNAGQSSALAAMCVISLVAGMLYAFLTNVLTFASADIGSGSAGEQATITALTRIGVVIPLVLLAMADRVGRRRVAVGAAVAAVLLAAASGLAPTLWVLAILQTLSRNLGIAAALASDTLVMEELPAGSRAAAAGLGALAWGAGAGVVVFALPLAGVGPAGWRLVFAVSLLALPLVVIAAPHLHESHRFVRAVELASTGVRHRISAWRFAVVGALFFGVNMIVAPSSQLQNDYLRADRGFSAGLITVFIVLTSTWGLFGVLAGTRMADRRGRKLVLVPGLVCIGVFIAAFFWASGPAMWVIAAVGSVFGALSVPALGVLGTELFPTSRRGQARGGLNALGTGGAVAGLLLAGALVDRIGYGPAFTWLALAPLVAAMLVLFLPETRGLELEALNEDRDAVGGE